MTINNNKALFQLPMFTKINYQLIGFANNWYENNSFEQVEVPWMLPQEYNNLTKPIEKEDCSFVLQNDIFKDNPQELIGSAEQGFIYLMLNNLLIEGKNYFSMSPCFREEEHFSKYHLPYFFKCELFSYVSIEMSPKDIKKHLLYFIECAKELYKKYINQLIKKNESLTVKLEILNTQKNNDELSYDININDIEVGSYGIRKILFNNKSYYIIYGTGLAEPRFSLAIKNGIV